MPENIFKIYPPKKAPSKDGRRGSGLWSEDDSEKRFQHVKKILDLYFEEDDIMDDLDLTWFLKNAVIGKINFSKKVADGINDGKYWPNPKSETISSVIYDILEGNPYKDVLLQVRKWLGKEYHKPGASPLRFEHVIPAKVYLERLKELYLETKGFNAEESLEQFKKYREQVAVCIITKDEDDALNKAGLRESMPDNWNWGDDIFARYTDTNIMIYKK